MQRLFCWPPTGGPTKPLPAACPPRRRRLESGASALWSRSHGLYDELRPGTPRSIDDEQVAAVVYKTLNEKPEHQTQWTVRSMAAASGMSKDTVHRIWRSFGLQPHRQKSFKLSTDPFFVEKVRDIVGLYLNPPEHALVLCVDEKSQSRPWSAASRCCLWVWAMWKGYPRLQTPWHDHSVCGAQHRERTGHGAV